MGANKYPVNASDIQAAYNDGYMEGHDEGYEEGYAQAELDMQQKIDEEKARHRAKIAELLDVPHNPNRRPTKINVDRSNAKQAEERRRLIDGE